MSRVVSEWLLFHTRRIFVFFFLILCIHCPIKVLYLFFVLFFVRFHFIVYHKTQKNYEKPRSNQMRRYRREIFSNEYLRSGHSEVVSVLIFLSWIWFTLNTPFSYPTSVKPNGLLRPRVTWPLHHATPDWRLAKIFQR